MPILYGHNMWPWYVDHIFGASYMDHTILTIYLVHDSIEEKCIVRYTIGMKFKLSSFGIEWWVVILELILVFNWTSESSTIQKNRTKNG